MDDMTFMRLCSEYVFTGIHLIDLEFNQENLEEVNKELNDASDAIHKYCMENAGNIKA